MDSRSLWTQFVTRTLDRVTTRVDTVVFNGIRYRRYPDAPGVAEQRYYVAGIADRQRGAKRLHEDIWQHHNGPIPPGHHIHHRDGNALNNDPSNLVALTEAEHKAHHIDERLATGFYSRAEWLEHLASIRDLTKAWHASEEGRQWHVQNGHRSWAVREETEGTCAVASCRKPYRVKTISPVRFCSNACKSKWRRESGLDNITRVCEYRECGRDFQSNRYAKRRFCSKSCAARARIPKQRQAG